MKHLREGIAAVLLLALLIFNSLSAAAAYLPPELKSSQYGQPAEVSTSSPPLQETEQTATISASVSPAADYYVEIPDRVSLGTLPSHGDFTQFYTVRVTMQKEKDAVISVSSPDRVDLTLAEKSDSFLPCHNQFGTRQFTKSGTAEGQLTILAQDIGAAKSGAYSGILQFSIRCQQGTPLEPTTPDPADPSSPVKPTDPPPDLPADPTSPVPNSGNDGGSGGGGTGTDSGATYYSATVSMRKDTDFNSPSMCNALFYRKADIVCKGDQATLTLYVIDPVPKFSSDGTPLSRISMTYKGKTHTARLNTSGKVSKHFDAAPGFIETSGSYSATPIVVQLPMQAVRDASGKAIRCSAYVSTVMKQNVDFYMVLKDLVQTGSAPANQPANLGSTENPTTDEAIGEAVTLTLGDGEKTHYESHVSMARADDFNTPSMCSPLFYEKADIVYEGELAELTVYVIDPVPKFSEEGTPISDVAFLYEGKSYTPVMHPEKQVKKHFDKAPGFIPEPGEYTVTPVSVVLPQAAIEDSLDAKLMCSAYINTVMHTTQKFYVILDELIKTGKEGTTLPETAPESSAPDAPQPPRDQSQKGAYITTRLFPQVLGYILFTSIILGGSFFLILYHRNGKDVFHRET